MAERKHREGTQRIFFLVLTALLIFLAAVIVWALDSDNDGMSDDYENFFGLESTNAADASIDCDGDGLLNLQEFYLSTDPLAPDTDRDGFRDDRDSNAVSRAYVKWGDPYFIRTNEMTYTWPLWMVSVFKIEGDWVTNPISWHVPAEVSNGVGSLQMDVDREIITNDLRLKLSYFDYANSELFIDLYNTNYAVIVTNLFGNILHGSNGYAESCFNIPFAENSEAVGIKLRREIGEITIYESLIYIDLDGDGLDREQEQQLGTSDNNIDSDGDGLSDYDEVFIYGTDPAKADTDGDGLNDYEEIFTYHTNPLAADTDGDCLSDYAEVMTHHTDPLRIDSDFDGMPDKWEIDNGFNPSSFLMSDIGGWWKFDEAGGNMVLDSSANTNHGIISGASRTTGIKNGAVSFAGNGTEEITISNSPAYKPEMLTVGAFVNFAKLFGNAVTNGAEDGMMVLLAQKNNSGGNAYSLYKTEKNSIVFEISSGSTTAKVQTADCFAYTGEWFHVVGTYDGTNLSLYINGEKADRKACTVALSYDFASGLKLGHGDLTKDGYFSGILDEVLILRRALPENSVAQLDEDISDRDGDGLTNFEEYQNGVNPSIADSDGDGLSDYQEIRQYGTNPNSSDTDYDGLPDGWEVQYGNNPLGISAALAGWWKLDETSGATAVDSRFGNNGTVSGAAVVQGRIYNARNFNGINDEIIVNNSPEYKPVNALSIAVFVDFEELFGNAVTNGAEDGVMTVLAQKNNSGGNAYSLYKTEKNSIVFEISSSTATVKVQTANCFAYTGVWFHMVGTYDGTNVSLYINGELVQKEFFSGSIDYDSSSGLVIGRPPSGIPGGRLNGILDELRIYSSALSQTEIQALIYPALDSDGDGLKNYEEAAAGLDPNNVNSCLVAISGNISYGGSQQGIVRVIAAESSDSWTSYHSTQISAIGAYSIGNIPTLTNYWLKAYRDSNSNGVCDYWEAQGIYSSNSISLSNSMSGVDIVLADPDSDNDNMPDWWEHQYFGNLNQTAAGDYDNDGLNNFAEYQLGTDPTNADTDSDGWTDGQEVNIGTDPKNALSFPATISGNISYAGKQAGVIHVMASTTSDGWTSTYSTQIVSTGSYTIVHVPTLSNYWIKVYRDSNGNNTSDFWEAQGVYQQNPVSLSGNVGNINITLTDSDTDYDGLSDFEEMMIVNALPNDDMINIWDVNPEDDFDGDGISNGEEIEAGLDPCTGMNENLAAYWPLNGNALDVTGNGADGVVYGAVATNDRFGKATSAMYFDGSTNSYIEVLNEMAPLITDDISISAWIKPEIDPQNQMTICAQWGDYGLWGGQRAYSFAVWHDKGLLFAVSDNANQNNGPFHQFVVTNVLKIGKWQLVSAVYDSTTGVRHLYVNGVEVSAGTNQSIELTQSIADLGIGIHLGSPTLRELPFHGAIDELRIYDVALSAQEISEFNDVDSDGLPDSWEADYFGNLDQTASGDYDNDGVTNLQEYQRDTDPADINSRNTTLYANYTTGSNVNDGFSASYNGIHGPKKTIGACISAAIDGDIIQISEDTYLELPETFDVKAKNLGIKYSDNIIIR